MFGIQTKDGFMKNNFAMMKVTCPKCDFAFKINALVFGIEDELTCFNCGFKFTIKGSIIESMREQIPKIKSEIQKRISKAEKGKIKISANDLNKMRELLKEIEL